MSEDVRTAEARAEAARILDQFQAWQQWQRSLENDPDDLQAFRRDMVATGASDPVQVLIESAGFFGAVGIMNWTDDTKIFMLMMPFGERVGSKSADPATGRRATVVDQASGRSAEPASPSVTSVVGVGPGGTRDPLAAARARGEQAKRDILATQGELLDAEQVAARLGIGLAAVEAQRQLGLLLALPLEHGGIGFPSWQFTREGLIAGLEDVYRELGVRSPWMRAAFFFSGDLRLDGRTPLETLLGGEIDAVRDAGAAYGEQLAS